MEFTVVAMITLGVGLALVFGLIVVLQARARLATALAASQQQAAGLAADVDGLRLERQALAEERARLQADALRLAPLEATLHERDAALRQRADEVQALAVRLERATTELAEERRRSEEKLAVLQEARGQLTEQFKNLSQEILEDKSRRFTEQNKTNL
ncbi:MAG: hypothetical protein ACSLFJ_14685, partial [Immundisolibacter sp.]